PCLPVLDAFAARTLFRSSDGRAFFLQAPRPALFRLDFEAAARRDVAADEPQLVAFWQARLERLLAAAGEGLEPTVEAGGGLSEEDRKSTRLNSSHVKISY